MKPQFKFPLYSKVARGPNEPQLLIVGYEVTPNQASRVYYVIDQDGIRDWLDANELEKQFIQVDDFE